LSDGQFAGFSDRPAYVPVPAAILGTLLRDIDSLGELKVTLHICRRLHEHRGSPRFARRSDLIADRTLLQALRVEGEAAEQPGAGVDPFLAKTVDRGTLLEIGVRDGDVEDVCYLLNTPANRVVAAEVVRGERQLGPLVAAAPPAEALAERSRATIFELYEQNIGLLTPLLAEDLREAELTYPAAWVEDAFREAVSSNKRSWRYVKRVLDAWADRGRGTGGETRRRPDPPADWRRYIEGRYGRLIRR